MLTAEERETMLDIKAVERELREAREVTRLLKEMLLAHVMYLQAEKQTVPDKYMNMAQKWGNDAVFWIEKHGKKKRIAYTVEGTYKPWWWHWVQNVV